MKNLKLNSLILSVWIVFLLSSCAGSGQYQTTRSHYTPNLAKEKLNLEVAWVAGVGASVNTALKISKHWGAVGTFQANYTSYNAKPFFSLGNTYASSYNKNGYSFDLGGNFNTKIGKNSSFNVTGGIGYNFSEYSKKDSYYSIYVTTNNNYSDFTTTKGAYWYIQPYFILSENKKIKHKIACRLQNYDFNIKTNEFGIYDTGKKNFASLSIGYGIDYSALPNLNFTTQFGLESAFNSLTIESGSTKGTNTPNSGWAKIGIQFILPSKK